MGPKSEETRREKKSHSQNSDLSVQFTWRRRVWFSNDLESVILNCLVRINRTQVCTLCAIARTLALRSKLTTQALASGVLNSVNEEIWYGSLEWGLGTHLLRPAPSPSQKPAWKWKIPGDNVKVIQNHFTQGKLQAWNAFVFFFLSGWKRDLCNWLCMMHGVVKASEVVWKRNLNSKQPKFCHSGFQAASWMHSRHQSQSTIFTVLTQSLVSFESFQVCSRVWRKQNNNNKIYFWSIFGRRSQGKKWEPKQNV